MAGADDEVGADPASAVEDGAAEAIEAEIGAAGPTKAADAAPAGRPPTDDADEDDADEDDTDEDDAGASALGLLPVDPRQLEKVMQLVLQKLMTWDPR